MTLVIRRLQIFVYRAPIETPVMTSFGTMRDRPAVLVRIEDGDGCFGWGEVWCNYPTCGAEHRARLVEDLEVHRGPASDPLDELEEVGGKQQPAIRVVPAKEPLDIENPPVADVDDRLEEELELAPLEASFHLTGERDPVATGRAGAVSPLPNPASTTLCLEHREVSSPEQFMAVLGDVARATVGIGEGEADRRTNRDLDLADVASDERSRQRVAEMLRLIASTREFQLA